MPDPTPLHEAMADSHPALRQGLVRCDTCGREQRVNTAKRLANGWPECCGYTMTLAKEAKRAR